jgi:diaminopimelate epimerase
MRFYKYHGAGNDFVLIDNRGEEVLEDDKSALAVKLCHRHFGVGGDGMLLLERSARADIRMRIFNPDGSEAEMCGNGIRCLAKHAYEYGGVRKRGMEIETLAGIKKVSLLVEDGSVKEVRVDMGRPEVRDLRMKIKLEGRTVELAYLEVGVPHAVILVNHVDDVNVPLVGRAIRHHSAFPKGTNVDFLERTGDNRFKIRTYERGVEAETYACATGITASAVAASLMGIADPSQPIHIDARGGTIAIELQASGDGVEKVFMQGPAEMVFWGEIDIG